MTNEQREALEYLVDMARGHDYAEVAKISAAEDVLLLALDDRDASAPDYQASPGECLDCYGGEDVCEECPAAPGGHDFLPVKGHPDDDECTYRSDGTDATYCGRPAADHDLLPCCRGEDECQAPPDIGPCDPPPAAEPCRECGPGYRIGDEGCRHIPPGEGDA